MKPTLMACLSLRRRASWRSSESSAPLPKGLVIEAWKARVGNSRDSVCSQRFVTHAGTCAGCVCVCVCGWAVGGEGVVNRNVQKGARLRCENRQGRCSIHKTAGKQPGGSAGPHLYLLPDTVAAARHR